MILTGSEIAAQVKAGSIFIDPFRDEQVKPDSYNYRLGPRLKRFVGVDPDGQQAFETVEIPDDGYVLPARTMTLGHTEEVIGSTAFAMSLIGKSSLGRLGLFLQVDADLGHTTSCHRWTLELVPVKPLRVYAGMIIGQVTFWQNMGSASPYAGYYAFQNDVTQSVMNLGLLGNDARLSFTAT